MFRSFLQIAKLAKPLSTQPCPNCLQRLIPAPLNLQPVRTTVIIERVNEVPLHKETKQPRLKTRHYIYKASNDQRHIRLVKARVILLKNVKYVGRPGDVLSIPQTMFYRKLYPTGHAVFATEANLELYDYMIKKREIKAQKTKEKAREIVRAEQLANELMGMRLPIALSKTSDCPVTPSHVLVALWKAGIEAKESCIKIPDDPVTGDDELPLSLTINGEYTAEFTGVIYRVGRDSDHLIPSQLEGFLKHTSKMKKGAQVLTDESS
ncbi:39S ribosomal protein L9, mitochondrial-like [Pecten maximus]|uniref:39S ribosomal protein L9, mitochondrial-like n=1 Tax=Pecten maximus TaxID=6579 RepID=UPI0014581F73|nr:39S ribosomal protein L9, mitochondrial-like [Pecten maximus]